MKYIFRFLVWIFVIALLLLYILLVLLIVLIWHLRLPTEEEMFGPLDKIYEVYKNISYDFKVIGIFIFIMFIFLIIAYCKYGIDS